MIQLNPTPKILQIDASGMPKNWISLNDAVSYYANDKVIYELGNPVATFRGGYNRITETQSKIITNSIIATKGKSKNKALNNRHPKLTNECLFERDRYVCAYCGNQFHEKELSRDHIKPICQKGSDKWINVVTACKPCNNEKGGRNLEQSRMSLLYLPYVPDLFESFILTQGTRKILADQMEFLLSKVSDHSRLKLF